ncbi:hypothetical protein [Bosea sp. (in: a-proteobacteria)]
MVARAPADLRFAPEENWQVEQGTGTRPWRDDYADVIGAIWRKLAL